LLVVHIDVLMMHRHTNIMFSVTVNLFVKSGEFIKVYRSWVRIKYPSYDNYDSTCNEVLKI